MVATTINSDKASVLEAGIDFARYVRQLREDQQVVLFLLPDDSGLVLSGPDDVFYDSDHVSERLAAAAINGSIRVYRSNSRELAKRLLPNMQSARGRPLDELLWTIGFTGYRADQCCLNAGCRRDDVIRLNRWPNFTRVAITPNSFKIASLFSFRPTSIVLAAKILAIPEQEIMQFYNAACYSGMVTRLNRKADEIQPVQHQHRGLISAILSHLKNNRFGSSSKTVRPSEPGQSCCAPSSEGCKTL